MDTLQMTESPLGCLDEYYSLVYIYQNPQLKHVIETQIIGTLCKFYKGNK